MCTHKHTHVHTHTHTCTHTHTHTHHTLTHNFMQINGEHILWAHIHQLCEKCRAECGLFIGHKLRHEHLYLTSYSKMNVRLAAQVFDNPLSLSRPAYFLSLTLSLFLSLPLSHTHTHTHSIWLMCSIYVICVCVGTEQISSWLFLHCARAWFRSSRYKGDNDFAGCLTSFLTAWTQETWRRQLRRESQICDLTLVHQMPG